MTTIQQIPLDTIVDHPDQPRYSAGDVRALAESIAELGVLEPILVTVISREAARDELGYRVLSGHRRIAAARSLDLKSVPGIDIGKDGGRAHEVRALLATNTARGPPRPA